MEFKNRPNLPYEFEDGNVIWASRSVAVVGVIILYDIHGLGYVLASKRGPNSADFQGKMNLVAGYLDWDETGSEAFMRECWEETGFDVIKHTSKFKVTLSNLSEPWSVNTNPTANNQNVTLRYGILMEMQEHEEFPILTTEHNEIEGEVEEPQWLPLSKIHEYEWAFNHDQVIYSYNLFSITQILSKP